MAGQTSYQVRNLQILPGTYERPTNLIALAANASYSQLVVDGVVDSLQGRLLEQVVEDYQRLLPSVDAFLLGCTVVYCDLLLQVLSI